MGTWYAKEWWLFQRPTRGALNQPGDRVICWYTGFTFHTFV